MSAKKILIPVDDSKAPGRASRRAPVLLGCVPKQSSSFMSVSSGNDPRHDRISDAELSTVQEDLQGNRGRGERTRLEAILDSHKAFSKRAE
jgi:hypothetical protein